MKITKQKPYSHQQTIALFCMCVFVVNFPTLGVEFSGGTGQSSDPYQIAVSEQLISIGDDPNLLRSCFGLINDIDLDPNLPDGRVFNRAVIAQQVEDEKGFSCSFDGNGHTIRNLWILAGEKDGVGLFGVVERGGIIRSLKIQNAHVKGGSAVGLLAGSNGGWIESCACDGTVSGTECVGGMVGQNLRFKGEESAVVNGYASVHVTGQENIGGLVGWNNGAILSCHASGHTTGDLATGGLIGWNAGLMQDCYAEDHQVAGNQLVGGLIGDHHGLLIDCHFDGGIWGRELVGGLVGRMLTGEETSTLRCFSSGEVHGEYRVGGLVGGIWGGQITACYARCSVAGDQQVGGLIGHSFRGVMTRCWAAGTLTGTDVVGGLVGHSASPASTDEIVSCLWDAQVSGISKGIGSDVSDPNATMGLSTGQMQTPDTWHAAGWDFESTWTMTEGQAYPLLREPVLTFPPVEDVSPYLIWTAQQLIFMGTDPDLLSGYCVLIRDIDLDPNLPGRLVFPEAVIAPSMGGQACTTLHNCRRPTLTGVFNGNGHVIRNCMIRVPEGNRHSAPIGFLGEIGKEAYVRQLRIENIHIRQQGDYPAGALMGVNDGMVSACGVSGQVKGVYSVGGLVGLNFGHIDSCYSRANVIAEKGAGGGLVGTQVGSISDCYSLGSVDGSDH